MNAKKVSFWLDAELSNQFLQKEYVLLLQQLRVPLLKTFSILFIVKIYFEKNIVNFYLNIWNSGKKLDRILMKKCFQEATPAQVSSFFPSSF